MNPESRYASANRRLGWILFGIFAGLTLFSVLFVTLRSH